MATFNPVSTPASTRTSYEAINQRNWSDDPNNKFTSDKIKDDKLKEKIDKNPLTNPLGELDKDAFMKLLLTELQYQDPTSPMDTDKMLTQTSQLASLETQSNTNKMMQELAKKMELLSNSMGISMVGMVGKMVTVKNSSIKADGEGAEVDIPFMIAQIPEDKIKFEIFDSKGVKVADFEKDSDFFKLGNNNILWATKDNNGNPLPKGEYSAKISFTDINGLPYEVDMKTYVIESVKFNDGNVSLKIGTNKFISFDKIEEIHG